MFRDLHVKPCMNLGSSRHRDFVQRKNGALEAILCSHLDKELIIVAKFLKGKLQHGESSPAPSATVGAATKNSLGVTSLGITKVCET